jgi:hypothetical protein
MLKIVQQVSRQLLHSWRLSFTLPDSGKRIEVEAPIPNDMRIFQTALEEVSYV